MFCTYTTPVSGLYKVSLIAGLHKDQAHPHTISAFSQIIQLEDTTNGLNALIHMTNIGIATSSNGTTPARLDRVDSVSFASTGPTSIISPSTDATFSAALQIKSSTAPFSVELLDPRSGSSLMSLAHRPNLEVAPRDSAAAFSVNIPASILSTKPSIGVFVNGKLDKNAQINLINVYSISDSGMSNGSSPESVTPQVPIDFSLGQDFPNPFNPSTTIEYSVPVSSHVDLRVYDMLGRPVCTLVNQYQAGGNYSVQFDGSTLPSGVYFYRLVSGGHVISKKMMVMK